jgi:hypothetical protein
MEKLHFEIVIPASAKKVYDTMIGEKTYQAWAYVFNETSHVKGSWTKGSKILFIGTDEQGKLGGMVSRIVENIPNQFISIEHYGMIKDGQEIVTGPEVERWAGSHENYTFKEKGGETTLSIALDSDPEYKSYFEEMWPKALAKLKSICE